MKLIAKTLYGLENVLEEELVSLGAENIKTVNRAVTFEGSINLLYRVNYCSRTAISVLWQIAEFRIRSCDDLYKNGLKIEWDEYFDVDQTFSVVSVVNSPLFRHSGYAGLVLKDSIADWFRQRYGRRPSVNKSHTEIVINLHVSNDNVNVSIDSSVIPLYKRGYRQEQVVAPVNEVLASGIIMLSGWDSAKALMDPMCGSGTILIEAAMKANNIASGKFRSFFGFQRWRNYDHDIFEGIKNESEHKIVHSHVEIKGSDISAEAVSKAKKNIRMAGLSDMISVKKEDFREIKATGTEGYIFINPPYGQRMKQENLSELYTMIGSTLKHRFQGHKAFIITSDRDCLKHIGLKPAGKILLFNGPLECLLLKYNLYEGSKRR